MSVQIAPPLHLYLLWSVLVLLFAFASKLVLFLGVCVYLCLKQGLMIKSRLV